MWISDDKIAPLAEIFEIENDDDGELRGKVEEHLRLLADDRRLLRTPEAAAILGVPTRRLARWAWRGEVPSVKLAAAPNAWRYFEPHVIEELRRGGAEAIARLGDNKKQRVAA